MGGPDGDEVFACGTPSSLFEQIAEAVGDQVTN